MDITLYTCNVGGYDYILPPKYKDDRIKLICFTDTPYKRVKGWEMRPLQSLDGVTNPTILNRYHKFFPHRLGFNTDWSVYIDGNMRVVGPVYELVHKVIQSDSLIACLTHPWRSTIKAEIKACKKSNKLASDEINLIERQYQSYLSEGMPKDFPLMENKVIIRNHNNELIKVAMDAWWDEFKNYVKRDQISLPYILWRFKIPFQKLPIITREEQKYFHRYGHKVKGIEGIKQYLSLRKHDPYFSSIYNLLDKFRNRSGIKR